MYTKTDASGSLYLRGCGGGGGRGEVGQDNVLGPSSSPGGGGGGGESVVEVWPVEHLDTLEWQNVVEQGEG